MLQNTVPKCKKCDDFKNSKIRSHTHYYCFSPNCNNPGRSIYAKDTNTSPKWCPVRVQKEKKL
jgi:hypothetical protein